MRDTRPSRAAYSAAVLPLDRPGGTRGGVAPRPCLLEEHVSVPALVRRRSKAIAVIALSALAATAAGVVAGQASQAATPADAPSATKTVTASPTGVYLVQLDEAPVVEYAGGVAGLRPTRVAPGRRLDWTDNGVRAYVAHLGAQRDRVLSKVGGVKLYDYDYTLAGFAAKMSYA